MLFISSWRCRILIWLLSLGRETELRFHLFFFVQKSFPSNGAWRNDLHKQELACLSFFLRYLCFPMCMCVYTPQLPPWLQWTERSGNKVMANPLTEYLLSNSISYWVIYSSNCLENGLFQWTKWHLKLLEKSNAPPSTRQSVLFSYVALGLLSLIPRPHRLLRMQQHPQITGWSSQSFHPSLWIKWVANLIKHTKINFQAVTKRIS